MGRYQSGQMGLAVNQLLRLRGFESLPAHKKISSNMEDIYFARAERGVRTGDGKGRSPLHNEIIKKVFVRAFD
jgi:hypothetical protein